MLHRRKITPTFHERMVWGQGDGAGLRAVDTRVGRVGALACWEHYNPLARFALMADHEQIHVSMFPGSLVGPIFAEQIEVTIRHHALESGCFVVNATGWLTPEQRAEVGGAAGLERAVSGGCFTAIVSPEGVLLGEPLTEGEGIVYADLDLSPDHQAQAHDGQRGPLQPARAAAPAGRSHPAPRCSEPLTRRRWRARCGPACSPARRGMTGAPVRTCSADDRGHRRRSPGRAARRLQAWAWSPTIEPLAPGRGAAARAPRDHRALSLGGSTVMVPLRPAGGRPSACACSGGGERARAAAARRAPRSAEVELPATPRFYALQHRGRHPLLEDRAAAQPPRAGLDGACRAACATTIRSRPASSAPSAPR